LSYHVDKEIFMTEIKLGQVYTVASAKGELPVRLERLHPKGGWTARALTHGRTLQIKDKTQLLFLCTEEEIRGIAQGVMPKRRSKIQGPTYREPLVPIEENGERPAIKKPKRPKIKEVVVLTKLSLLDATHRVLSETKKAMTTREIVAACVAKRYWTSNAITPWQTLNAALNRDIAANGTQSRFQKNERGKFALR
jgi:hypothetical protein